MTNGDIHSILAGIQAAKEAFDRLPQVEAQLHDAQNEVQRLHSTIVQREEAILSKNKELEAVRARLSEVIRERDDVSFRELEATDRVATLGKALRAILAEGEAVLAQVDGEFVRRTALEENVRKLSDENVRLAEDREQAHKNESYYRNEIDTANANHRQMATQLADAQREIDRLKQYEPKPEPDWKQDQAETSMLPPKAPEVAPASDPSPEISGSSFDTGHGSQSPADPAHASIEQTGSPEQVKPVEEKPWWERPAEQHIQR